MDSDSDIDIDVDVTNLTLQEASVTGSKLLTTIDKKTKYKLSMYQSKNPETVVSKNLRRRQYIPAKVQERDDATTVGFEDSDAIVMSVDELSDLTSTEGYSDNDSVHSELPDINETEPSTHELPQNAVAKDKIVLDSMSSDSNDSIDEEDVFIRNSYNDLVKLGLLLELLRILQRNHILGDFMTMVKLMVAGTLSVTNIPFLLTLDLARFKNCKSTTTMYYRDKTKKFWQAVYRFGGGAVIRLFSGLKNFAHVCLKKCKKGFYDPKEADVTFAVPDMKILNECIADISTKIMPGFLEEAISKIDRSKEYNMCIDGKKVSPGCGPNNCGDINMFGFEKPSIEEQNNRLKWELNMLDKVIDAEDTTQYVLNSNNKDLQDILTMTSNRIMDQRKTECNQELLKMTFQKMMDKDPSVEKKYTHAIDSIETYQVFSQSLILKILAENKKLCHVLSQIRNNSENFCTGCHINLEYQGNCVTIRPPHNIIIEDGEELLPEYTKQGSDEWFNIRSAAYVTGSTAFKALGLDSAKKQMDHFKQYVTKEKQQEITPELQRLFDHGRENEVHGFATLGGIVLPALFPNCKKLTQVGAFFIDGDNKKKLVEVSPDGFITNFGNNLDCTSGFHGDDKDMSVELKSPIGDKKFILPVHYKVPVYYVPQLLLEMRVLEVDEGIYSTYSKQSTTVIIVEFDEHLWKKLWALTKKYYDKVSLKRLIKCSLERSELQELISTFVKDKCKFILEVPSCTGSENPYIGSKTTSPFRMGLEKRKQHVGIAEIKPKLIEICENLKKLISECYEMQRRKATEIVMIVLNDTDRMYNFNTPYAFPVAYFMKGYSLDVKTMREIIGVILDRMQQEGINIVSTSFDGQWFNIAVRSADDTPLTRLQLMRKVWSKLGRISKESLLKKINSYTKVSKESLEHISSSHFLTVGSMSIGNVDFEFNCNPNRPESENRQLTLSCCGGESGIQKIMNKIHTPLQKDRPDIWIDDEEESNDMSSKDNIVSVNNDTNLLTLLPEELLSSESMGEAIADITQEVIESEATAFPSSEATAIPTTGTELPATDEFEHNLLNINTKFLDDVLHELQSGIKSKKWEKYNIRKMYNEFLKNQKGIEKLTSKEMDEINTVFNRHTQQNLFKPNQLKAKKVRILCRLLGRKRELHVTQPNNTKRITLRKLCTDVIKDIDYPVMVVAVALANCFHWECKKQWENEATMPMRIKLPNSQTVHDAFCYPEFSSKRNKVEFKFLDPTHILTNMRSHICGKGYKEIKRDAFLRVSEKDNEILNRAYVVNCLDKQSAANAIRFFGSNVQMVMYENGDDRQADIVGIIRGWYEAVDMRGLSVVTRTQKLQDMFELLSDYIKFDVYPPPKKYVAGIPIVTFESLMRDITSRLQLYFSTRKNKYNQRSISTLTVETKYGHLSRMEGSYNGCPKSVMVPNQMKRLIHMGHLQTDPSKGFNINISNRKKYPDHLLLSSTDSNADDTSQLEQYDFKQDKFQETPLIYRNHKFDKRIPTHRKKRNKNVEVATGNRPLKRESGVRIHYKVTESKVKSSTRHGLKL